MMRTYADRVRVLAYTIESNASNVYRGERDNGYSFYVKSETGKFCGPRDSLQDICIMLVNGPSAIYGWARQCDTCVSGAVTVEEQKELLMRLCIR